MIDNHFFRSYEHRRHEIISHEVKAIAAAALESGGRPSASRVIQESEKLGDIHDPYRWRAWYDLQALDFIEPERDLGRLFFEVQDVEIEKDRLPAITEFRDNLDQEPLEADISRESDWKNYTIGDKKVHLPSIPSGYFKEHFSRHGWKGELHESPRKGEKLFEIADMEASTDWGDVEFRSVVRNDLRGKEDMVKMEARFYRPGFVDEELFNQKNGENYLEKLYERRVETLVKEVDKVYEKAREVVENGIDINQLKSLEEINQELGSNHGKSRSVPEMIEWSRERALEDEGYFGLNDDRISYGFAEFVEEETDLSISLIHSGNKEERAKKSKLNSLFHVYYDALEEMAGAKYSG